MARGPRALAPGASGERELTLPNPGDGSSQRELTRRRCRWECNADIVGGSMSIKRVHPVFPGKNVPVRKKAPPSRKSEAIATHAAPGVNGHGNHGTHGPQPSPQSFFPLPPHLFGGGGRTQLPGRGCGGPCFLWVPSLIWGGAEGQRCPFNHLPRNSRKNHKKGGCVCDSKGVIDNRGHCDG